jgi:O-methyltransferase
MCPITRMYALHQAARYVVANNVPGAIVECGVWRGGSVMMAALTLQQAGIRDREIYLFDTFEGQPPPSDRDVTFKGGRPTARWRQATNQGVLDPGALPEELRAYASLDEARANVYSTGYPQDRFVFVKGKVEDTLPESAPGQIAILRLDTDWYESTYHELQTLFPLVSERGVIILDDYGFWEGARTAVDQYLREQDVELLLHRIDDSGRMAIKNLAPAT